MSQIERSGGPPSLRRWDPFRELDELRDRMARLLDQTFTGGGPAEHLRAGWSPRVDVEETNDAYLFEVDVPGAGREDISVEVDGDELRITGQVREREREGVVHRQSRMTGRFEFRTTLPREVDAEQISASLEDGVLSVRVPKVERSQPRRVQIGGRAGGGPLGSGSTATGAGSGVSMHEGQPPPQEGQSS